MIAEDNKRNNDITFDIIDLGLIEDTEVLNLNYSRKDFYTATLLRGNYSIEFEDEKFNFDGDILIFTNPKIPFGFQSKGPITGASCIFSEDVITKKNCGYGLFEFPMYRPDHQNVYSLTANQSAKFVDIFSKMFDEKLADNDFSEHLQRNYLLELIFNAQKLIPTKSYIKKNNTREQITCSFFRLLESQFPIDSPEDKVKLKTAGEFAERLYLHPNYLNRQIKLSKGRTVSEIINARLEQEAKILLKVTNWNIAQIATSLGFEEPSNFNSFFKKHTKISPTDYRKLKRG